MSRPRTDFERERDRAEVAELYLKQWTQQEIADKLDLSRVTVGADLKFIQKSWRESSLIDMNEAKQRELERIDKLEREYWRAWEKSQQDAEESTQKAATELMPDGEIKRKPGGEVVLKKKGQSGDASYLRGIQWCIEQRCKILGIEAPQKVELAVDWRHELRKQGIDPAQVFEELVNSVAAANRPSP